MTYCRILHTALTLFALLTFQTTRASELKCHVEVNADQIQNANKETFATLGEAMAEYMNTTSFSSAQFTPAEKIECNLFFTVKEYSDNVMSGELQIQSLRPVFNSAYTTTLLNMKDTKVEFEYNPNDPLVFTENTFESNLTAILNFYAYLILAVDFDSFSPLGGQPFFERAANIVHLAQSSGQKGWQAFDDNRNRSAVLNAFTDGATGKIRQLIYQYHRRGLDEMSLSPDKARAEIGNTLDILKQINENAPMSVILNIFHDAKLDELINVYSKGSSDERKEAFDLLSNIYPADRQNLNRIKDNQ